MLSKKHIIKSASLNPTAISGARTGNNSRDDFYSKKTWNFFRSKVLGA
jgi:hypothetical protein